MPEAPEVRVVQDYLNANKSENPATFVEVLSDQEQYQAYQILIGKEKLLTNVQRIGKSLFLNFENHIFLAGLGMTGYFEWVDELPQKSQEHQRYCIGFKNKWLIYSDPRNFGRLKYLGEYNKIEDIPYVKEKLGIDVFELSPSFLPLEWSNSRKSIRNSLLEQKPIAGIGNYLANEILFSAKVHPQHSINILSNNQLFKIIELARTLSEIFYQAQGNSFKDFQVEGVRSNGQSLLKVYQQKFCIECKTEITRISLNNRPVFYCGKCQC